MKKDQLQTMKIAFEQICDGEREWTALGNFMNYWYAYAKDQRELLIRDQLPTYDTRSFHKHQWAVFCAASVEWFCHTYHVPCPTWVYDPQYTLPEPWFFDPHEPTKSRLLWLTPAEFSRRNIYCGDDIYANKWEWVQQYRWRRSIGLTGRLVQWAAESASSFLSPFKQRWQHVQGVVERAYEVGKVLKDDDRFSLIAAAYLHDIGYAPALEKTGFHPLDGACYLRSLGLHRLACLVAHHSEARFEARLRGYETLITLFPRERSATADALTYCDFTTGPAGQSMSLKERRDDILERYGETDIVREALRQSWRSVSLAVARTSQRLSQYEKKQSQFVDRQLVV